MSRFIWAFLLSVDLVGGYGRLGSFRSPLRPGGEKGVTHHPTIAAFSAKSYDAIGGSQLRLLPHYWAMIKNVFLWVNGYCNDHTYPSDGAVTAQSLQNFNRSLFYIRTASL